MRLKISSVLQLFSLFELQSRNPEIFWIEFSKLPVLILDPQLYIGYNIGARFFANHCEKCLYTYSLYSVTAGGRHMEVMLFELPGMPIKATPWRPSNLTLSPCTRGYFHTTCIQSWFITTPLVYQILIFFLLYKVG